MPDSLTPPSLSGKTAIVILAAGKGVRMKSSLPKVLHRAAGRSLVSHVVRLACQFLETGGSGPPIVVAGSGKELVASHLESLFPGIVIAVQDPPLGTGDAARKAAPHFGAATHVAVLAGDAPMLRAESLAALFAALGSPQKPCVAFLTAILEDPGSYGRVIRNETGDVVRIVEAKDATPEERAVREINSGIYAFDRTFLEEALPRLTAENAQGEYYLTDVLGMATAEGKTVTGIIVKDPREILGVNSRKELAEADRVLRERAVDAALTAGVTIIKPETVTIDDTVVFESDVVIEPFATILGTTRISTGCTIGQGAVILDTQIERNVEIRPYSVIEKSRLGEGALIGPFARLREGTDLAEGVHIGNFVETKKARLGKGAKANHLTYLGDAEVGARTNVGAGVITCNYDGYFKHKTTIGENVFVGSDVQLVAPVTVGDGALIGAGTTVTKDIPPDTITTSRVPQENREGAAKPFRERKQRKKNAAKSGN